jgi:exodeoxyribonuclease V gamma subunit
MIKTMGFELYASRYIDRLVDRLVSDLSWHFAGSGDAFLPVHIVTQTEGINVWLSARIAEKTGISANFRFLTPQSLLEAIHETLKGKGMEKSSQDSVVWVLYRLLGEASFRENPNSDFKRVVDYMGNDGMKRLGLASKLADLFDQYQIYRHTMIEEWNKDGAGVDDFQKHLWHRLKETSGDVFLDKTVLRSSLLQAILNVKVEKERFRQGAFGQIYFFGLSVFTPYHLEIMESLSELSDIKFYMLNPAASDYWYEDLPENIVEKWKVLKPERHPIAGNNLLINWGRIIQQTFGMVLNREGLSNTYVSLDEEDYTQYHAGKSARPLTRLSLLQQQIMFNVTGRDKVFDKSYVEDDSIQVHACYTPAREVEALYNYLAALFEKNKNLRGRDVVVSCDIDLYAPYIRAVFDTGTVKFNYTISDATYAQGDSPLKALVAIMELGDSEFNAEEVLRLLDYTCIREKFKLTDVSLLREVVRKSMFRFGVEGKSDDDSRLFGLKKAIERIVHGIAMRIEGTYSDFFPLDLIEGHDSDQAIRFCQFAEALAAAVSERKKDRTLEGWTEYAESLMETFLFDQDTEDEKDLFMQELVNRELGLLNSVSSKLEEKVPYRLFSHFFSETLSKERRMRRFHTNGITFCSYVPMRSLPFKVVCMMGLDHDKFPRQEGGQGLSKIDGRSLGDRNVRSNDKHLFLESLMSAESHLFISYRGASVKDNSNIPPSVLVDELVNYILDRSEDKESMRNAIVVRHPLHSFSHKYNQEDSRLVSFLIEDQPQKIPLHDSETEKEKTSSVELKDLFRFFSDPFKYHYNKDLNIYFEDVDENLPISEKFEMDDNLDKYILRKRIIFGEIDTENQREWILSGELPPQNMGAAIVESESLVVSDLKECFRSLINEEIKPSDRKVSLDLKGPITLQGKVGGLYGSKLIDVNPSGSSLLRKLIQFSIHYLSIRANEEIEGHFITKDKKGNLLHIRMKELSSDDAYCILENLIEIFKEYEGRLMPFHPDLFVEFNTVSDAEGNIDLNKYKENVKESLEDAFDNQDFSNRNEGVSKKYLTHAEEKGFLADPEFPEEFARNSIRIIKILVPSVFEL